MNSAAAARETKAQHRTPIDYGAWGEDERSRRPPVQPRQPQEPPPRHRELPQAAPREEQYVFEERETADGGDVDAPLTNRQHFQAARQYGSAYGAGVGDAAPGGAAAAHSSSYSDSEEAEHEGDAVEGGGNGAPDSALVDEEDPFADYM